jgi:hypothetical protein
MALGSTKTPAWPPAGMASSRQLRCRFGGRSYEPFLSAQELSRHILAALAVFHGLLPIHPCLRFSACAERQWEK